MVFSQEIIGDKFLLFKMAKHNVLGERGEALAVATLRKKGYEILVKNHRHQEAEIDIIARTGDTLVKVKTRNTPEFGLPQEFVKPRQIAQLLKAADFYITDNGLHEVEARFDIVSVIINKSGEQLEHIENAFYHFQ